MSGTLPTFVAQLESLGLVPSERLANLLPPHSVPKDVQELLRELVRSGDLTKYQAQEVLQGRGKSLTLAITSFSTNSGPAAWAKCSRRNIGG